LNFKLSNEYTQGRIRHMLSSSAGAGAEPDRLRLGMPLVSNPQRVIVDFSSPNIAKEMHVGHLRSTIIGDTLSRIFEFIGHDVLRLNHVGDWGTQFGMLIHYLHLHTASTSTSTSTVSSGEASIGDLVEFYRAAKKKFDEDPDFAEASRREVVKLQSGDKDSIKAWKAICQASRNEFQQIYDMLGVQVEERGESFYNPLLNSTIESLFQLTFDNDASKPVAVLSEGAVCIFLEGNKKYRTSEGTPLPLMVRKSDGGYLYASTDLAALRQRSATERADKILYVTDIGQALHFDMVFEVARTTDFLGDRKDKTSLIHVPFGLVQGEDGKKFKTRSGDTVKLKDLLNEAVLLTEADMLDRKQKAQEDVHVPVQLSDAERQTARTVGIAAVKYADLCMNRESNYKFSYKKMLSLTGNTAPYMLYAYARIQGIKRKALEAGLGLKDGMKGDGGEVHVMLTVPEEAVLARHLDRFDEVLLDVSEELYPNKLCDFLFELSQKFNQFYEKCPVLKAETDTERVSRTALCVLTADVLKVSLKLLGVDVVERL